MHPRVQLRYDNIRALTERRSNELKRGYHLAARRSTEAIIENQAALPQHNPCFEAYFLRSNGPDFDLYIFDHFNTSGDAVYVKRNGGDEGIEAQREITNEFRWARTGLEQRGWTPKDRLRREHGHEAFSGASARFGHVDQLMGAVFDGFYPLDDEV